jgi:hypothetical protein
MRIYVYNLTDQPGANPLVYADIDGGAANQQFEAAQLQGTGHLAINTQYKVTVEGQLRASTTNRDRDHPQTLTYRGFSNQRHVFS